MQSLKSHLISHSSTSIVDHVHGLDVFKDENDDGNEECKALDDDKLFVN
jgi:hypothetical protein